MHPSTASSHIDGCGLPSAFTGFRQPRSLTMSGDTVNPDSLASAVNAAYASLRYKPPAGQYTILAGFVLVSPQRLQVISLATGSKCLPAIRLSGRGESVNDSHAETLAKRGALLWFFDEVHRMKNCPSGQPSPWLERNSLGKYQLQDMVRIHMYISTVPCKSISFTLWCTRFKSTKAGMLQCGFWQISKIPKWPN